MGIDRVDDDLVNHPTSELRKVSQEEFFRPYYPERTLSIENVEPVKGGGTIFKVRIDSNDAAAPVILGNIKIQIPSLNKKG
jgi:hypothetical protein